VVDLRHLEISVVGLGLIGGSIMRALSHVSGWDLDESTCEDASRLGYAVASSLEEATAQKDIVVVATSPETCVEIITRALELSPQATVVDVGSVKAPILEEVTRADGTAISRYVPAHPLAGAAHSGWAHSATDLLSGAPWAVCPHSSLDNGHLWRALTLISALDGYGVGIEASTHDRVVAYSSHVPQLVASVLAAYAPPELSVPVAQLHGGGLRDATRVASSPPELWEGILRANTPSCLEALDKLVGHLEKLRGDLAEEDWKAVESALQAGREGKARLDATRWAEHAWQEEAWALADLQEEILRTEGVRAATTMIEDDLKVWTRKELP